MKLHGKKFACAGAADTYAIFDIEMLG